MVPSREDLLLRIAEQEARLASLERERQDADTEQVGIPRGPDRLPSHTRSSKAPLRTKRSA
jgi:hypothetical protein